MSMPATYARCQLIPSTCAMQGDTDIPATWSHRGRPAAIHAKFCSNVHSSRVPAEARRSGSDQRQGRGAARRAKGKRFRAAPKTAAAARQPPVCLTRDRLEPLSIDDAFPAGNPAGEWVMVFSIATNDLVTLDGKIHDALDEDGPDATYFLPDENQTSADLSMIWC